MKINTQDLEPVDLRSLGRVAGLTIGFNGWTGNQITLGAPPPGKKGWHVFGSGVGKTAIAGPHDSVAVGVDAKHVRFDDLTVETGGSRGFHIGVAMAMRTTKDQLSWEAHNIEVDGTRKGVWPVFCNQVKERLHNVRILGGKTTQHNKYGHGQGLDPDGGNGIDWKHVECDTAQLEGCKQTGRPMASYYLPGTPLGKHATFDGYHPSPPMDAWPTISLTDCNIHGYGTDGKGAAITMQGAQANLLLRRVIAHGEAGGNGTGLVLGVDDSAGEQFGVVNGAFVAGAPPTSLQTLTIEECLFVGDDGPSWWAPLIDVGPLRVNAPGPLIDKLTIRDCGIYGVNRHLDLRHVKSGLIQGCNTAAIERVARRLGVLHGVAANPMVFRDGGPAFDLSIGGSW